MPRSLTLRWLLAAATVLAAGCSRAAPLDQPMPPEQFQACVQSLASQTNTAQRPLRSEDFLRYASTAQYDDRVRQSMLVQVTEPTFWWDDLAATTDDQRVEEGRAVLAREREALQRIEAQFGVPKEIIVALYGIETNYGPALGRIPILDATISLACLRPCPDPAKTCSSRERAYAAVRLLRDNKVKPETYRGSWAGAFGRTQFVPDTFEQIAVDGDGDGVADIVGSERDAWASTANHLVKRGGWITTAPVYVEVVVPPAERAQFATGGNATRQRDRAQKASAWAAAGWQAVDAAGKPVPLQVNGDPELFPFLPVGLPGPAFLVSRNFLSIFRYNNSEKYVMEVAVLANKLAGGPGIVTPWPTDDPGLSRAQVRELQSWLVQQGYGKVTADGVMGRNTRDAIEAERAKKGLPPGRRVGQRTMRLLMQS
ncbi:lytic murein transglycosylase [Ramlibacter albus]|uniref:Lytic murein transglycosylase n=1 Tax=Ramlibacter albus TaxID=2079448 RepID=A0A923MCB8_9BURK|nr:lytic murein transglycosylase [Ramlibacter albus]MBC5768060.1 lytic murein transglycosylase [Ramlibacter albus]